MATNPNRTSSATAALKNDLEALRSDVATLTAALTAMVQAQQSAPASKGKGKGRKGAKATKATTPGTETTAVLTAGTRDGFVQLAFAAKPTDAVRATLKAHGVRWAPSTGMWYGTDANVRAALTNGRAKVGDTVTVRHS